MTVHEREQPAPEPVEERAHAAVVTAAPGLVATPSGVLAMQRLAGNRAARELVRRAAPPARRLARQPGGGHDLRSPRFAGDPVLEAVFDGTQTLKSGATGLAVTRVEQALADFGLTVRAGGAGASFDTATTTAVKEFQRRMRVTVSGEVDAATLGELDRVFTDRATDRMLAQAPGTGPSGVPQAPLTEYAPGTAPSALTAGTRTLTAADRAAIKGALTPTPAIDPTTGRPPVFKPRLPSGEVYETRLKRRLGEVLDWQAARAATMKTRRAQPGGLHDWADIERVAVEAKRAVDAVFGSWARRPALRSGTNLFDQWAVQDRKIGAMTAAQRRQTAVWRVEKVVRSDKEVEKIGKEHGVLRERRPERTIIERVKAEIARDREAALLDIHRSWPGAADPATSSVFLQVVKETTPEGRRAFLWKTFQILVHEYIHTLAHTSYEAWADASPQEPGHTLREGMTDYLTKTVWKTVNTEDAALRRAVEGADFDAKSTSNAPPLKTYDASVEAEKAVGIAGTRNAYAAYFLGAVDLLGGP